MDTKDLTSLLNEVERLDKEIEQCQAQMEKLSIRHQIQAVECRLGELWLNRGRLHLYLNRLGGEPWKDHLDPAVADFEAGMKASPEKAALFHALRGLAYIYKWEHDKAADDFRAAAEKMPPNP